MYNLMIGIAIVSGIFAFEKEVFESKVKLKDYNKIHLSLIISITFSILGAKAFETLYKNQLSLFMGKLLTSGFTYFGGLVSGGLCFYITNFSMKINNKQTFNLCTPPLILSHGIGRIGCFFAGCCFGKPTESILGVSFPPNSIPAQRLGQALTLHPTQIYESIFLFFLYLFTAKFIPFNYRVSTYLLTYPCFRFCIEFLRGDFRGNINSIPYISPSQFISILLFCAGILLFSMERDPKAHIA